MTREDLLAEAAALHAGHRLEDAGRLYARAIALDPDDAAALHGLGLVMLDGDLAGEAENLIGQAREIEPENPVFANSLGLVCEARGDLAGAVENYRVATRLDRNFGGAWTNLGFALGRKGDHIGAASSLGRAAELVGDPLTHTAHGDALRYLGKTEDAVLAYRAALARDPDHSDALIGLAMALDASNDAAGAEEALRRALLRRQDSAAAWANLGSLLMRQRHYPEAIDAYRWALHIQPDHSGTNANLGAALLALGRFGEAAESCRAALAHWPEHAEAHLWLGLACLGVGDRDGAVKEYDRAVFLKPELADSPEAAPLKSL